MHLQICNLPPAAPAAPAVPAVPASDIIIIISYPYQIHKSVQGNSSDYVMLRQVRPRLWLRKPQYLRAKLYIVNHHSNSSKFFIILLLFKNSTSNALSLYIILSILSTSVFKRSIFEQRSSNIRLGVLSLFVHRVPSLASQLIILMRLPEVCKLAQCSGTVLPSELKLGIRKAYGVTLWVPPPL